MRKVLGQYVVFQRSVPIFLIELKMRISRQTLLVPSDGCVVP